MLVGTFYTYSQTKKLLVEQAYSNMRQDIESGENAINNVFKTYETIINLQKNQKRLSTLLSLDYTDLSYSDIAYYTQNNFDNILVLYPSLDYIHIYSSNDTLPDDQLYFWGIDELDSSLLERLEKKDGEVLVTVDLSENYADDIMLISNVDYYLVKTLKNYIALGINQESISEQLYQGQEGNMMYLLGEDGCIISSTGMNDIGEKFDTILPNWESLDYNEVCAVSNMDGQEVIMIKVPIEMDMTLVMTVDKSELLRTAQSIPLRVMAIFLCVSLIAFAVLVIYSRNQNERLNKILNATVKIGNGEFGDLIDDMGKDEFGQIASAVNQMNTEIDTLIKENYERQIRITVSEMNLLQEQINPHFLYNALSVINSLSMKEGAKRTGQSVKYLSDFYRMSLSKGKQVITIEQEVGLLQNYVKIQLIRFPDMITISYEVDDEVLQYNTIKLILQPLVENAIQHGQVEERVLNVKVRAWSINDRIIFEVEDDGYGIDNDTLERLRSQFKEKSEGFGLKNVDTRIKLNYGDGYGLDITSEYGHGTKVHVEIPKYKE
jgi:two-component system sensor histidine kinase YesM